MTTTKFVSPYLSGTPRATEAVMQVLPRVEAIFGLIEHKNFILQIGSA